MMISQLNKSIKEVQTLDTTVKDVNSARTSAVRPVRHRFPAQNIFPTSLLWPVLGVNGP